MRSTRIVDSRHAVHGAAGLRRIAAVLVTGVFLSCDSSTGPAPSTIEIIGPAELHFDRLAARAVLDFTTTGDPKPIGWFTTDKTVATVEDGVVTATGDGTAYIIVTSGSAADSVLTTVSQVATDLLFISPPQHTVRDQPFTPPVQLAIVDAGGSPLGRSTEFVTVSLDAGGNDGLLIGTKTRAAVNGVATFADLSIDAAGISYHLEARATSIVARATSHPFDVVDAPDRIVARNNALQPIGLLIDGGGAAGPFNDLGRVTSDSIIDVVINQGPDNELIAFTQGRPPILVPAVWSSGTDTVDFAFPDPLSIPVTIWIVKGPFGSQQSRASFAVSTTSLIWNDERMGLGFSDVEMIDATGDPDAPALYDMVLCNQQSLAETTIGKRAGRINIYYVGTVDSGTDRGRACGGGDFIMMAERSGNELLSHEIGHLFGLGHVDNDPRFDRSNVMHSASNTRQYLTEGQVFRSHYHEFSALRITYGLRTDAPRTCGDFVMNVICPSLARRLFDDGFFPADESASPVTTWLLTTCTVGADPVVAPPRAPGAADVPELARAVEDGPPARIVREARASAVRRHAALRRRLYSGATFGLRTGALASLRQSLAGAAVEREMDEFREVWREAAVRGLGIAGSPDAARVLERVAAESGGRLAAAARRALAAMHR